MIILPSALYLHSMLVFLPVSVFFFSLKTRLGKKMGDLKLHCWRQKELKQHQKYKADLERLRDSFPRDAGMGKENSLSKSLAGCRAKRQLGAFPCMPRHAAAVSLTKTVLTNLAREWFPKTLLYLGGKGKKVWKSACITCSVWCSHVSLRPTYFCIAIFIFSKG